MCRIVTNGQPHDEETVCATDAPKATKVNLVWQYTFIETTSHNASLTTSTVRLLQQVHCVLQVNVNIYHSTGLLTAGLHPLLEFCLHLLTAATGQGGQERTRRLPLLAYKGKGTVLHVTTKIQT